MTRRRGTASLVASPVLVGAVTVLISIIAVFIAYNANAGLPFVPTYDLKAEIPSGGKLVKGNEVRTGGFRVGVVEEIAPKVVEVDGERKSVAVIDMKLDKTVEPLATDTTFYVRPRSALGLKYVELVPGKGEDRAGARRHGADLASPEGGARARDDLLAVRRRYAGQRARGHRGLRRRLRRPRPVAQHRD